MFFGCVVVVTVVVTVTAVVVVDVVNCHCRCGHVVDAAVDAVVTIVDDTIVVDDAVAAIDAAFSTFACSKFYNSFLFMVQLID